jgi:GT2 family glycosyltransferase
MIEVVAATRLSEGDFWNESALGQSLQRLEFDARVTAHITYENRRGLPDIYNSRIAAQDSREVLVFVHDDVWLDDYYVTDRILEACEHFDVVGIAGNRRRTPGQPGWAFIDSQFTWDEHENLSGRVAHGKDPCGRVSSFGPCPADCELLDGVFLAARKSALLDKAVRFDARFDFHFYDLDFCRTARSKGLRLGTWPICITHQSNGGFGGEQWQQRYRMYLEKWGS